MVVGVTEGFTKSLELVELVIELLIKDKKIYIVLHSLLLSNSRNYI
jgi:ribosomal protein L6P/L9E